MAKATLLDLPVELLRKISHNLSYASHLSLSLTCREIYFRLDDPNKRPILNRYRRDPKPYDIEDLLEIERWPAYDNLQTRQRRYYDLYQLQPKQTQLLWKTPTIESLRFNDCWDRPDAYESFACHLCLKIRSMYYFSHNVTGFRLARFGAGSVAEKSARFCIPCGIKHGTYQRGQCIMYGWYMEGGGGYGFVCRVCGGFDRYPRTGDGCPMIHSECDACLSLPNKE